MTLKEAIKINEQLRVKHWSALSNNELHASSLGIEALKAMKNARSLVSRKAYQLLPGETEK